MKGKHITFIGLNYAPEDTAIGLYSTQMVQALIDAGAFVNVVTSFPYYPQWKIADEYKHKPNYLQEHGNGFKIYRYKQYVPAIPTFLKRILQILSFTKGSFFNLRKIHKVDIVISIIPFTASAWLAGFHASSHKAKNWVHIQDFEFDAAVQSGLSRGEKKTMFKFLFSLEKHIFNKAHVISTISHLMIAKLTSKTNTPSYYLPNWIDENEINPSTANIHPYLNNPKFKLLYSGNIGDKQDWDFFYAFAKALPKEFYEIIIVGAGAKLKQLQEQVVLPHVTFHKPVPFEELSDLLCSANAHFLFQKTNVIDTVMPSKLLGMMASGKPSLILGNALSEVRVVLEKANAGVYLIDANVDIAVRQVEKWRNAPESLLSAGDQSRKYVIENFSKDKILGNWIAALTQL